MLRIQPPLVIHRGGRLGSRYDSSLQASEDWHVLASRARPHSLKSIAQGKTVLVDIAGQTSRHRIGAELKVSLRTKDPAEAKSRAVAASNEFARIWESFRHPPRKLTHKEVQALAGEVYREIVAASEDEPGEPEAWEAMSNLARTPIVGSGLRIGGPIPKVERAAVPTGILSRVLARHGLVQISDESARALGEAALKTLGEASGRLAQNARGDYSPDLRVAQFPSANFEAVPLKVAAAEVSLTSLADNWAKRNKKPDDRTIKRYKGIIVSLVAFLGHDDASRLTDEDIVRWHSELLASGTVSHETFVKAYRAAINTIFSYAMSPQGGKKVTLSIVRSTSRWQRQEPFSERR